MCGRNKGGWVRGLLAERAVTTPRCGLSPSGKSSARLLLRALPLAPDLLQGWEAAPRPRGASSHLSHRPCGRASYLAPVAYYSGPRRPKTGNV